MRADKPNVSVIIVSYNVAALLVECLHSLYTRSPDNLALQVIVVDNASNDASTALVREFFPETYLIENSENYGFPYACNQGAALADGEYLFFLNPDARVALGAIEQLVKFLEQNLQVGVVGPQLRYEDNRLQSNRRRFPGFGLAFLESTILQRFKWVDQLPALQRFYMDDQPADTAQAVDWLVGAAFMVRHKLWQDLGGMDEGFFMYSEELDFCRRVKMQGWEVWYLPAAVVTHAEGQSSMQDVPRRHISFNTSKVYYFRKYYGTLRADLLRGFLLMTYRYQLIEEAFKLLLRHKPELRRQRIRMAIRVLMSKLLPRERSYNWQHRHQGICLLSAEYPPQAGGVGDYTATLAAELSDEFKLYVITNQNALTNTAKNPKTVASENIQVIRTIKAWNWNCLPAIVNELNLRAMAIVNIQYQTGAYKMHPAINFLPLYLKWRYGAARPRVVTTFHDLLVPYLFPKAGRLREWVTRLLAQSSDAVVVTNEADYQQLRAWGLAEEKIQLVPIGSNITPLPRPSQNRRSELRQKLGLAVDDFVVGYFGLLNRNKGLDTLLKALEMLKAGGNPWKLLIIGGEIGETDVTNREYAREIDQLIKKLDIEDSVIRTGHLTARETSQSFYALDAAALPFRDGSNFRRGSLLALLAHGVPVVTTSVNDAGEKESGQQTASVQNFTSYTTTLQSFRNGKITSDELNYQNRTEYAIMPGATQLLHLQNVILVTPEQPAALAEALDNLRANPALREALHYGALKLSHNFSWEKIAQTLREVYSAC